MSDTLSEVLRAVRLSGGVFFTIDASAPWVAETPAGSELGPHLIFGAEHVIDYHLVTSGSCWGGLLGEPPVRLEAGDIIVFPQGDAHTISSAPGLRGDPALGVHRLQNQRNLPISLSIQGGGSERAQVVCGFLGCDARPFNPLLSALPRVLHLRGATEPDPMLRHLMSLAVVESNTPKSGSECVLSKVSELLFIEVVRRYVTALPPGKVGWLAGLRDGSIGRALHKIHERPAHAWSLESLAKEVAMSRSMLAERFLHFVGIPPMQYLAQWRIQLAASLLRSSKAGLAEIAERVGYGSEAALSRAFKRCVGIAPAGYRRGDAPASASVRVGS